MIRSLLQMAHIEQLSRMIGLSSYRPVPQKINQRKLRKRIRQGCVVRK